MPAKSLTGGAVKEVAIFPQGLGGLRDYLDKLDERPTGNVLGIDIGFNTIIFTLFSPQRKQIIHGKTLNKRGVHRWQQVSFFHASRTLLHQGPSPRSK